MTDTLRHRGPDGEGERLVRSGTLTAWLGHRRLSIVDLTDRAAQPMASADGTIVLTYNGEVYNFRELRRELAAMGAAFASTGDSEVVLRAYEVWGPAFVERLDGMFALAIYDAREERLLLARDRTGKKPLYYAHADGRLAFGSEIKAVLACPWVPRRPDLSRLDEFLGFGYVPTPGTLLEGIEQVPPASVVAFDRDGLRPPQPYWDALPAGSPLEPGAEVGGRVAELVESATRRRLIADVPLGALLSGGIDSSVVVALMARLSPEPVHTFAIGFPDDASYDERDHARTVADHLGTRHLEFAVEMDAVALLDRLLWHHDQPFADSSAIPTHIVARLAREQVKVVLTGDGGDEVFGGYDRFRAAAIAGRVPPTFAALARAASRLLPVDHGYHGLRRRAERFLAGSEASVEDRYNRWVSVLEPELVGRLGVAEGSGAASLRACSERAAAAGLPELDRILYANFKTYLPDDLAVKTDRMSMAHSLEVRSPFLDTALVEYLARLPARHKVGLRQLKPVLRQAFGPLLPDEIWERRKHGFGVPMGAWFRGELGTLFADEVLARDARSAEVLRQPVLRELWESHRGGKVDHGPQLWTVLTLERWLRSIERPQTMEPVADAEFIDAEPVRAA
jgi:asparagine synthase (glutamine-hydrolysing)